MCLKLSSWVFSPKKKRKDIICYKVIEVKNYVTGLSSAFRTPCTHSSIPFAVINGTEDYVAIKSFYNVMFPITINDFNEKYVAGGFIHVFKHLKSAETFVENSDEPKNMKIYECIIPAGTEYYQGIDQLLGRKAYAAEKIKFIKRVV